MEFDYGLYADDGDHHIDLRNPRFRQEPMGMHNQDHFGPPSAYGHHLAGLSVDVKPRLTKEQHDILESHYQQQNKPNTQTKKGFAETLGVSLDKVNNWFQNRRAKSKQDAKKQAGAYSMLQSNMNHGHNHHHNQQPHLGLQTEDLSPTFCASDYYNAMNDSAVSVDPMALHNGLGISQSEQSNQLQSPSSYSQHGGSNGDFAQESIHPLRTLKSMASGELEAHRRTLTQEQFDSFGQSAAFVPSSNGNNTISQSPRLTESSDLLNEYFPELCDFNFDSNAGNDSLGSTEPAPTFSADTFATSTSTTSSDVPSLTTAASSSRMDRNPSTQSSISEWSDTSTPSVSITHANQHVEQFGDDLEISPRGKTPSLSANTWQPGQSVPVDFVAMEREFREAAMRSASNTGTNAATLRSQSDPYSEQPLAFPVDEAYLRREKQLTQSIGNLGINNDNPPHVPSARNPSMSGSIAARRQRPRPQPLSSGSLRSASYCGQLPTSPGHVGTQNLTPAAPTLRRIKSSNVMNGIASGRIQKNVGMAQRSPLNFSFAEAVNSPKFARSVSTYSPAQNLGSGNLAPPTPLSPNGISERLDLQRQLGSFHNSTHMVRQPSINEEDMAAHMLPSSAVSSQQFTSPPNTPLYPTQFSRHRLGSNVIAENTPPQSAPATQQSFGNVMFNQHGQQFTSSGPMLQSQGSSYAPVMSNEYPQMPHVMMPYQQQMSHGQYMDMSMNFGNMPMQQMSYGNMAQMSSGGMNGYMAAQQPTPPHSQYPFVPSSPGVLMSSQLSSQGQQPQHKQAPPADFFVHEYSPPREMKRTTSQTPRKGNEAGPRNYTFANHGPEHFEKSKKDRDSATVGSSSPSSSAGGSSTG